MAEDLDHQFPVCWVKGALCTILNILLRSGRFGSAAVRLSSEQQEQALGSLQIIAGWNGTECSFKSNSSDAGIGRAVGTPTQPVTRWS